MILETDRLILRELQDCDFAALQSLLQDPAVMYAYEGPFSRQETCGWFEKQKTRYKNDGFGLWSVIRKADDTFIGQCGITMQSYRRQPVPEIGYLLRHACWHAGYATEAAAGCKRLAFGPLGMERIYSFIRDSNLASQRVALRNGMWHTDTVVKHFRGIDMPHFVFCAERTGREQEPEAERTRPAGGAAVSAVCRQRERSD